MPALHEPTGGAFISQVTTPAAVVADHQRTHAVSAHVTHLVAVPANDFPVSTATATSTIISTTPAAAPFCQHISLGALPSNMASNVTEVANWFIRAVTSQMPSLPAVVAGLLIGTVNSEVPLLVAVVAESHVARRKLGSCTVPRKVAGLATGMADALVGALAGQVARLLAVPAQGLASAFRGNVPRKPTVVADSHIGAFSSIMPWSLAILAQIRSP